MTNLTSLDSLSRGSTTCRCSKQFTLSAETFTSGQATLRCHLVERSLSQLKNDPVQVRPAEASDSQAVFQWRNDLAARLNSRNQELITQNTHEVWFQAVLHDPDRHMYIGESNGKAIGQVRFDFIESSDSAFEVSISVDPEMRGQSLALPLLLAAEKAFLTSNRGHQFRAYVHSDNTVSQILFERAGYRIDAVSELTSNWLVKEINV